MNPYEPQVVDVIQNIEETPTIYTLRLRFRDKARQQAYRFAPGQFNMLYLYGVGEIPISIVSDPADEFVIDHTIRSVGRVTKAMSKLKAGDQIGLRGPFGRGWPLQHALGKDVILVTGGLGCAPVVSVIRYVIRRRDLFGRLVIMQGVKHADDLIWRDQYEQWETLHDTQVILAASEQPSAQWPWHSGHVTDLMHTAVFNPNNAIAMMCGPEAMMNAAIDPLLREGLNEHDLWLSMERNMHCAIGLCGHCQYGANFICKQGPVFPFAEIKTLFGEKGF
ncbi:MAG: FAD/NAD(P)-binding protein [Gammaproteobacteria bacterium]|nr:FAD/NAD(P)-binding protein [Gammaproteobacteria bacterium]MDH5729569.1 FAD/NAD(P)-binding protein [Gammaproteobacteria bacterium]